MMTRKESNHQLFGELVRAGMKKKETKDEREYRVRDLVAEAKSGEKTIRKIINGKVENYQHQTIRNVIEALDLSFSEQIYAYGLMGLFPLTQWPSTNQIVETLDYYAKDIAHYPYPAYVISCYLDYFVVNPATAGLVGTFRQLVDLVPRIVCVFDLLFNSSYEILKYTDRNEVNNIQKEQIRRFFAINWNRRHEPYFQDYKIKFGSKLSDTDKDYFFRLWEAQEKKGVESVSLLEDDAKYVLGYLELGVPETDFGKSISFRLFAEPIYELGELFYLIHYRPANEQDNEQYKRYFSQFASQDVDDVKKLKIWSHPQVNIADILRQYQKDT